MQAEYWLTLIQRGGIYTSLLTIVAIPVHNLIYAHRCLTTIRRC